MSFAVSLGLDNELPMMVWADVLVLYPHEYVVNISGRSVRASEGRVQQLVTRAIREIRRTLKRQKAQDYLAFRSLVVQRLCDHYGFVLVPCARRTIVTEEVDGVVLNATPTLRCL